MQKYFFLLFLVFVINGSDVAGPADDSYVGKKVTIKLNSGTELTTDEFVPFSQSSECARYPIQSLESEFCFSVNGSSKIKVANGSQVVDYDEVLSKIYREGKSVFIIPFPLTKISTPTSQLGSVSDCQLVALGLDGEIYSRDVAPEGSKLGMLLGAAPKEIVLCVYNTLGIYKTRLCPDGFKIIESPESAQVEWDPVRMQDALIVYGTSKPESMSREEFVQKVYIPLYALTHGSVPLGVMEYRHSNGSHIKTEDGLKYLKEDQRHLLRKLNSDERYKEVYFMETSN